MHKINPYTNTKQNIRAHTSNIKLKFGKNISFNIVFVKKKKKKAYPAGNMLVLSTIPSNLMIPE